MAHMAHMVHMLQAYIVDNKTASRCITPTGCRNK